MQCLENDTAAAASEVPGTCCWLRLLLGWKSVFTVVLPVNLQNDRVYAPSNVTKHDIAPGRTCCIVGQRSPCHWWCQLLSQNWAALSCSSSSRGESGRQILRWWLSKIQQAKAVSFSRYGISMT